MTQEDKELLLKDLSARLPYGIKCEVYNRVGTLIEVNEYGFAVTYDGGVEETTCKINNIKPYLFPLSSMTDEQRKEYEGIIYKSVELHWQRYYDVIDVDDFDCLIDFYHKNHLDYRGLIRLGLAIDATNLNIY